MRHHTIALALCGLTGSLVLPPPPASAAAPQEPQARTLGLVAAFQAVRSAPEGGQLSKADAKHNEAAFATLDGFFDYDNLVGDAIGPHKAKLSSEELTRFSETFVSVVRLVAYPDSGSFLTRAKLTHAPAKKVGARVQIVVSAVLEEEDLETDITFFWTRTGSVWRVVDVGVDGASLVTDYANQFGRILEKEGAKGLLGRLESKLAELRKAAKTP